MKRIIYLLCFSLIIAFTACGGKSGNTNETSNITQIDSIDASGLQRMQASTAEVQIKFKGKNYQSVVSRMPDETLPRVANEMGDTYADNKITLRLTRDGETIVNKTFTKNDFSSVVEADFLRNSILEGLVYDKTTPQGIVYAASVCYPQTDLYVPLSITITVDGKMNFKKVESLEDNYDEKKDL